MTRYTREDAIALISASKAADGDGYIYRAGETDEWYRFDEHDLDELVGLMNSDDEDVARDAYSHWCSSYGDLIGSDETAKNLGLIRP